MNIRSFTAVGVAVALLGLAGCATTGGSQTQTTIYDMHRRIVKLDKTLEDSVTKLNETTTSLSERVNENDQQTRQMKTISEENQVKLDKLAKDLNEFRSTLYRHFNLTPPSAGGIASAPPSAVEILPPPGAAPVSTAPVAVAPVAVAPGEELSPAAPAVTPMGGTAAVAAAPAPAAQPAGDPNAQYQAAQAAYANGDYNKALQLFDENIKQFPQSESASNSQFWKAKCYLQQEKYRESIQEFDKMRTDYPASSKIPFAMHNQAVAHSRVGEAQQAIKLLDQVIKDYPISPAADQAKSDLKKLKGE